MVTEIDEDYELKFTIKWTDPQGETKFAAKPEPVTKKTAEAWIKQGSVEGWKGVLVPWSEYLKNEQGLG